MAVVMTILEKMLVYGKEVNKKAIDNKPLYSKPSELI